MAFNDRFTSRAAAYAASRPSYPREALELMWAGLGDPASLSVADIGAGTGISSRLIASFGPHVFAVEPNRAMREAAQPDPRIEWIDGTAERTMLPDRSIDVVAAFQAWHWADHDAGIAEVRRILKPRGNFSVVYNERDERDPFTAAFGEIVRRYALDETERRRANALARALGVSPATTRREEYRNRQTLDRAGVHARADSSSYLPQSGTAAEAMHADIDALLDRFEVNDPHELHLVTIVVRVDL